MLGTLSIGCRVKILIQNIIEVFLCILSLYIIYDWITGMDKVRRNVAQYCLKYIFHPITVTSPQLPRSSVPKVAVVGVSTAPASGW